MFSVRKSQSPRVERLRGEGKRNEAIPFLAKKRFSRAIISARRNCPDPRIRVITSLVLAR